MFINTFRRLYEGCAYCIKTEEGSTEFFTVDTDVRQECIPSPMLFILTIDYVMKKSMNRPDFGIMWDGKRRLTDLDLADHLALIAETPQILPTRNNILS